MQDLKKKIETLRISKTQLLWETFAKKMEISSILILYYNWKWMNWIWKFEFLLKRFWKLHAIYKLPDNIKTCFSNSIHYFFGHFSLVISWYCVNCLAFFYFSLMGIMFETLFIQSSKINQWNKHWVLSFMKRALIHPLSLNEDNILNKRLKTLKIEFWSRTLYLVCTTYFSMNEMHLICICCYFCHLIDKKRCNWIFLVVEY